MKSQTYLVVFALCAAALPASAQELTLFEATEQQESESRQTPVGVERSNNNRPGEPTFTLRGTSRFGDRYSVYLSRGGQQQEGKSLKVDWTHNSDANIPGHPGYQVVDVSPRSTFISLPNGAACEEFPDQGVECTADGRMLLSLAASEPVQSIEPENGEETVLNPFTGEQERVARLSEEERERRAQRQAARAERLRQFEPPRIPDDEVPEGMRKVSTPFGDRLVPENQ